MTLNPGLSLDQLHQGDCLNLFPKLQDASIDLVFADPPFNIGYDYDVYHDKKEADQYLDWSKRWIGEVARVLKPDGAFWLAIGDEFAAELKVIAHREVGLSLRNWVIWYYTFGVHCKKKFARSHAHLFYFVRDPKKFKFNDLKVRVPSARQLVYFDTRADPKGRVPDDTWILRPQDVPDGFSPEGDTWYVPASAAPSRNAPAGTAARCRSKSSDVSSAPVPTKATSFLTPSAEVGQRSPWPKSSAVISSASNSPRNTPAKQLSASKASNRASPSKATRIQWWAGRGRAARLRWGEIVRVSQGPR